MRRRGWILWATVTIAAVSGVWLFAQGLPNGPFASKAQGAAPTRAELADLQGKADAACLCGRTRGQPWDEQCWGDYRRSVARFHQNGGAATACREESTSSECFGPEGPNQLCVSTQRMYGACSDAEERTRMAEARRRNAGGCSD